jgi:hypothetical protein
MKSIKYQWPINLIKEIRKFNRSVANAKRSNKEDQ